MVRRKIKMTTIEVTTCFTTRHARQTLNKQMKAKDNPGAKASVVNTLNKRRWQFEARPKGTLTVWELV
jgi:hypothetical protein